ncbi:centrosomal protein of 83 kDa-like [Etheostoma spectabile]|uniref:centrosomal protein of 83 kDa-like n=1 Tax=Etheostoma spectabile TaxID=54343 RepID=UPI0013AF2DD8|nr:centrosomal protein of 83 kDa-like [Etheostoma spectabile]
MASFQKGDVDNKYLHKTGPMSAYHHYVLSSILPDAEREYLCTKNKNKVLEKENEVLRKKVDSLMTYPELFKAERQKLQKVIKNRDHQWTQLLHCKNELSVLGKKMTIKETDLRRLHKQTQAQKEELESTKMALQSVKRGAVTQRAEQLHLKERLDQVIKERDGLNDMLLRCKNESSELRDKISNQQSSMNKRASQCKEQMKQIHLLKLENQTLQKERGILDGDAEVQRQELQKCEEELNTQKEKLKESKRLRAIEDEIGKKIVIIQQKTCTLKKPSPEVPLQKVESLQKELLAQTEELRKTQKRCEELLEKLTKVAAQFLQCRVTVRDQKEKLKAVTAERDMYRSQTEKVAIELADIKKGHRSEKQRNRAAKRLKKVKLSTGDRLKVSRPPPVTSKVQMQSELSIVGTKL